MVPVVMLRVAFGHACLDVCASPGSETTQMLECLAVGDGRTEQLFFAFFCCSIRILTQNPCVFHFKRLGRCAFHFCAICS